MLGQLLNFIGRVEQKHPLFFLARLVAMTLRAQALKDVVQECVLPYLSPREYMVNVLRYRYPALAQASLTKRLYA